MLIAFRVIQGIGGAVMSSLTLALISSGLSPGRQKRTDRAVGSGRRPGRRRRERPRRAAARRLLLVLIFWVNVPIGAVAIAVSLVGVTESQESAPRPLDVRGVALSTLGLFLVTLALVYSADATWASPVVAGCLAAGALALVAFVVLERRTPAPMAPPALLRTRSFAVACGMYLLAYLAFSGFIYYVTLYFQNVQGWSALHVGLSWLFFCIPYFVVAQRGASSRAG